MLTFGHTRSRGAARKIPDGVRAGILGAVAALYLLPAYAFKAEEGNEVLQTRPPGLQAMAAPARSAGQVKALEKAERLGVEVVWHETLPAPSSIRGSGLGSKKVFSGGKGLRFKGAGVNRGEAVAVLDDLAAFFRIGDAEQEFAVKKIQPDAKGNQHVRLNQTYRGLRVFGGEMIVHFDRSGQAYEVGGQYKPDIKVGIVPSIKAAQAVGIAQNDLRGMGRPEGTLAKEPELVVFARETEPLLAYEFVLACGTGGRWRYWIDALKGTVLLRYNDIKRIDEPTTDGTPAAITGNRLPREGGEVVDVDGWLENTGYYYLYNTVQSWRVLNAAPLSSGYPDAGTYAFRDTADWGDSDPDEISAANNVNLIQQYYQQVHGRSSYDGNGTVADAYVHQLEYGFPMANAYWDGTAMHIGDGDGSTADSLAVLDVFAHEYTHAVTEHTCDLVYANESGALNESFSDIFGVCVEFYGQPDDRASYPATNAGQADWLMGEDCWLASPALRDMRNPANAATVGAGGRQPTRYKGSFWYSGTGDNGGVHQNAGVQNFFFYLLCEGGSGTNDASPYAYDVKGIGITNAERVAYQALSVHCTANTTFSTIRTAWVSAALDLDVKWVRSVRQAWNAVLGLAPPPPFAVLTASDLPAGRVGSWYAATLRAGNGIAPYVWQLLEGELPPSGLTLDASGALTGLPPPEAEGTTAFKVTVTDATGEVVTNQFSLTIRPPFASPYEETFEHGGEAPDSWTQTMVVNGQPWTFGGGSPYGQPGEGYAGSTYCASLAVVEQTLTGTVTRLESPMIDFGADVRAGRLTFWHYMAPWDGGQDALRVYYKTSYEGTWTQIAEFTSATEAWTQRVVDLPDPNRSYYIAFEGVANYGYGVHIDDVRVFDPVPPLTLTDPEQLPDAYTERFYSYPLTAAGGVGGYTFDVVGGALPAGMGLSADGVITGTVAAVQSAEFTVRVMDSGLVETSAVFRLDVALPLADLYYEGFEHKGAMPAGWANEVVVRTLDWRCQTGGGDGNPLYPYHQPATAHSGEYNAALFFKTTDVFQLNDDHKTRLVSPAINLGKTPATARLVFWHCMTELDGGQDELRVYYKTSAEGDWVPLATYTANVPAWTERMLLLPSSSTYYLAFEGNARFGNGVCIDDIRITDGSSAPVITSAALPNGLVGQFYSQALAAAGGIEPYTWAVAANALPLGLGLHPDGVITGVPARAETLAFSVQVTGVDNYASTNLFSLRINPVQGSPYAEDFENGGAIPSGWTVEYVLGSQGWTYRQGSPDGTPPAPHSGSYNACFYSDSATGYRAKLVSPMLDLGVGSTNVQLTFWLCMASYSGNGAQDHLTVFYKTHEAGTWVALTNYINAVPVWTQQTLALPNPTRTTYIAFEGLANGGQGVCIDDVDVTGDISTYASWKAERFSEAELADALISGDQADPDGDGVPNGLEYAMGLDPWAFDTEGLPFGGVTAGYLTLSFRMDKDALNAGTLYVVEACTDLILQDWTTVDVSEYLRADSNTWWQAFFRHDVPVTNAPQRFLRLKVTLP
ncbi:MAG: M4 family metallopeptidase [Kiritimatiellae bacterium]|nr:M4 family metallopeptidase [Kiritimatiellia bacterium]